MFPYSWTAALTTFLNQLSGHLARRTCREAELAAKRAAGTADGPGGCLWYRYRFQLSMDLRWPLVCRGLHCCARAYLT